MVSPASYQPAGATYKTPGAVLDSVGKLAAKVLWDGVIPCVLEILRATLNDTAVSFNVATNNDPIGSLFVATLRR